MTDDDALTMLRVLNEETVIAGYPGGDRNQTLANVRAMRDRIAALTAEVATAKLKYKEEAAQIVALMHERDEAAAVLREMQARIAELERRVETGIDDIIDANDRVKAAQARIAELDELATRSTRRLVELSAPGSRNETYADAMTENELYGSYLKAVARAEALLDVGLRFAISWHTNKCYVCNTGWSEGAPDIHTPICPLARVGHTIDAALKEKP